MSAPTVTVTWTIDDITFAGTAGTVVFALSDTLVDTSDGTIISPDPPRRYPFSGVPGQSDPLVANDGSTLVPSGSHYTVTIGGQTASYSFDVLILSANGGMQSLADLIEAGAAPVTAYGQYLPLPSGTAAAGDVPVATGAGNESEWGTLAGGSGYPSSPVVSGTPTAGQVLTATSPTQAAWETPSGGSGAVSSVFGRTGAVTAESGDYTAAETGALALPSGSASAGYVPVATGSGTATQWQAPAGAVASVNGQTGTVTLTAAEVGADASGAAAAAQAASLPLPSGGPYPGGTTDFLRADGTWDEPPGSGGSGSGNIDGGSATTGTYPVGNIDGGNA